MNNAKGIGAMIVGVITVVLGIMLPFYEEETLGEKSVVSIFYSQGISMWGLLLFILLGITVFWTMKKRKGWTLFWGCVTALVMFIAFMEKSAEYYDRNDMVEILSKGPGYYVSVISTLVILATAIIYFATIQEEDE